MNCPTNNVAIPAAAKTPRTTKKTKLGFDVLRNFAIRRRAKRRIDITAEIISGILIKSSILNLNPYI